MADYRLTPDGSQIIRTIDGAVIPTDPANSDFAVYTDWLAAGNAPDPVPASPPPPSVIPVAQFWARFTPTEQAAIQTASTSNPSIAQAMTFALLVGQVNLLAGPIVTAWMAALVAASVITAARRTAILTP